MAICTKEQSTKTTGNMAKVFRYQVKVTCTKATGRKDNPTSEANLYFKEARYTLEKYKMANFTAMASINGSQGITSKVNGLKAKWSTEA